jgi:hypothetical protein
MTSLREMGLTMGEYAEKLMNSGLVSSESKPQKPIQTKQEPVFEQKDISNIQVPNAFIKQVLGKEYKAPKQIKQSKQIKVQEETQVQSIQLLNEEKIDELLSLLRDVKNLLSEMTTVGSLGVNLAGPTLKDKKPKRFKSKSAAFRSAIIRRKI